MIPAIKLFVVTLVSVGTLVVSPSHSQPFLAVKPVNVQHFSQLTEPNDIQPALGVRVLQNTQNPQVTAAVGKLQPAARYGLYQRTFDPQQQQSL